MAFFWVVSSVECPYKNFQWHSAHIMETNWTNCRIFHRVSVFETYDTRCSKFEICFSLDLKQWSNFQFCISFNARKGIVWEVSANGRFKGRIKSFFDDLWEFKSGLLQKWNRRDLEMFKNFLYLLKSGFYKDMEI